MKQKECVGEFRNYLCNKEKATVTIRKCLYDVNEMLVFIQGRELNKKDLLLYRKHLTGRYKAQTVNVKLSVIYVLLRFMGLEGYRVEFLKAQKRACVDEKQELMELDYKRLMETADRNNEKQLYYLMLVLYETGTRVSELPFVTVRAIKLGKAEIYMKGRYRVTIFPKKLVRMLKEYTRIRNMQSGCVFRTKSGRNLDRGNICHVMKRLCKDARVRPTKVFPHSFRHLFARCPYSIEKNLVNLTDILGYSSIETIRTYVIVSISQYKKITEKMKVGFDDKRLQNNHSTVRRLI